MNNLSICISSLAMDLNRVALGLNRGSIKMAERFYREALNRKAEINSSEVPPYIENVLKKIDNKVVLNQDFAERALVYSILLENFVVKRLSSPRS